MQAFLPTPASKSVLVGKAAVIVVSTLALAVHALWARPFAPAQAWKGPVRAALLVLAATSAAVVAWAGALDLRILSGTGAQRALTAGSYALALLFGVVIALLVAGVAAAMLRGVRDEQAQTRLAKSVTSGIVHAVDVYAAVEQSIQLSDCSERNSPAILPDRSAEAMVSTVVTLRDSVIVPDMSQDNTAFAVIPVRRRQASSRRRQNDASQRRLGTSRERNDPIVSATAAVLSNAAAEDHDVVAACDGVTASLDRLPIAEAQAVSAALLPCLSARLDAALGDGSACDSAVVAAVCCAMAALSDHAKMSTLSRLARCGAPAHIAAILRQCVASSAARSPPVPTHALWLLGNLSADKTAAAAFTAGEGAEALVALLSSCHVDAMLDICVAAASLSSHAEAARALLRAGMIPALMNCIAPQKSAVKHSADDAKSGAASAPVGASVSLPAVSLAVAEAAFRALANVLRHCAEAAEDTARANRELAACGAIAGCTTALQCTAASTVVGDFLHVEFAARAAEALHGIVRCASVGATAPSEWSAAASDELSQQVTEAGTEDAVMALLGSTQKVLDLGSCRDPRAAADMTGLCRTLTAVADALRRWLLPMV